MYIILGLERWICWDLFSCSHLGFNGFSLWSWYLWMENALFRVLVGHQQGLSLLRFLFLVTPDRIPVFLVLGLGQYFVLIHIIDIWVGVEGFVVENIWISFGGNPRMTLWLLVALFGEGIDLFLESKELILQEFGAILLPSHHMEMLGDELLVIFDWCLEDLIQELPDVDLLPFYPQLYELTCPLLQKGVEKPFLLQLVILTLLPQLGDLPRPLSDSLARVYHILQVTYLRLPMVFG